MSKPILTVDPGASGGLALMDADGTVQTWPMPDGMTATIDLLRSIAAMHPGVTATVEKVGGYMPGNAGPGAATFARHCGHIEAALYCLGVPTEQVAPQTWQKAGGWSVSKHLPAGSKDMPDGKAKRQAHSAAQRAHKNEVRDAMARRFPALSVTLKTADALGIMVWATGQMGNG